MSLTPGATLGPYAILAELGHRGMGVVYTAHDPRLKRQVAIKLLTADLTRDETAKQRFLQEAQAASALDHPPDRLARFKREAQIPSSLNHPQHRSDPRPRGSRGPRL